MAITAQENAAVETIPTGTADVIAPADAPVTAPDGAGTAIPDTDPATDVDGRVAAVWAALNAEPGSSATVIGAAAGLSRMVAGKILNQFEAEGRARREPGVNGGQTRGRAADRWFPINNDTTAPDTSAPGTSDTPGVEGPGIAPAASDADASAPEGAAVPGSDEGTLPAVIDSAEPIPADEPTDEADMIEEEKGQPEPLSGDEASGEDSDGVHSDLVSGPDAPASELSSEPVTDDPAWARVQAELAELIDLFGGVTLARTRGSDVMALGCLEMAMSRVASVHRNARAVLTGTDAAPARPVSGARPGTGVGGGVRPGALRDRVHAHLLEYPDKDFTPYEIGKVLDASSGAVANALDRLVNLGHAVLTCERPRRFALAPAVTPTQAPAPAEPGTEAAHTHGD
ncbi:hypothetical protein AB0I81_50945 [Nonomuraea sp. NPDC050404]|uniref:hypothetical protein n=1 Tax=Nonomuraea sp. NPDC050404 TaxID=3155783 RepID=UPI0033E09A8C